MSILIALVVMVGTAARPLNANSPPALDGVGSSATCQASACAAQQLTTRHGNDVILLFIQTGSNTTKLTLIDSNSLSFTQRLSYGSKEFHGGMIWEYYAVASSPINSDNITVLPDQHGYTIRGMLAFGIAGADTSIIYDQDRSVPSMLSCPTNECGYCLANYNTNPGTCSASIRTSGSDLVIAAAQINDSPGCGGYQASLAGYHPPSGFTRMAAPNGYFEVDYTITKTPGQVEFDCNGTDATGIVLDAIIASSSE